MLATAMDSRSMAVTAIHPVTLAWLDSREALILRWCGDTVAIERIESEVPAHHRATGRVRHEPFVRSGGSGGHQASDERHRLEHLDRFIERVAEALPPHDELVVVGPGPVRDHLATYVRERDARHHLSRPIHSRPSRRLTERQLVARLRHLVGADPARRTVGAYRWTGLQPAGLAAAPRPRRVLEKPPRVDEPEFEVLDIDETHER
jgi:hypothetical protein